MSILLDLLRWLKGIISRSVGWLLSVPGMITFALADLATFICTLVGKFEWTTQISGWIDSATAQLHTVSSFGFGTIGHHCFTFFALDTLAQCVVALIGCTIGFVTLLFSTLTVVLLTSIVGVLSIKFVMRLISISSAGFVDP